MSRSEYHAVYGVSENYGWAQVEADDGGAISVTLHADFTILAAAAGYGKPEAFPVTSRFGHRSEEAHTYARRYAQDLNAQAKKAADALGVAVDDAAYQVDVVEGGDNPF